MRSIQVLRSIFWFDVIQTTARCTARRRNCACTTYNCIVAAGNISQDSDHIDRSSAQEDRGIHAPDPRRSQGRAARRLRAEREAAPPNTTDPCGPVASNRPSWAGYRHGVAACPLIVEGVREHKTQSLAPALKLRMAVIEMSPSPPGSADRRERSCSANNKVAGIEPIIDHVTGR
jgi:hypothetical protein